MSAEQRPLQKVNSCQKCSKSFINLSQLVTHRQHCRKTAGNIKPVRSPYRCYACKGTFHTKDLLADHVAHCAEKRRTGSGLQFLRLCNICHFRTPDDKEFLRHIKNQHTVVKVKEGIFLRPSQVKDRKTSTIIVPVLKNGFSFSTNRTKHTLFQRLRHPVPLPTGRLCHDKKSSLNENPIFECHKCGSNTIKKFHSKEALLQHRSETHEVQYCHLCHLPLHGTVGLRSHVLTTHDSEDLSLGYVVDVPQDGKGKSNPGSQVQIHRMRQNIQDRGIENNPALSDSYVVEIVPQTLNPERYKNLHPCIECKYMTYHSQSLVRHVNDCHAPMACFGCGVVCKGRKTLVSHMREEHNTDSEGFFSSVGSLGKPLETVQTNFQVNLRKQLLADEGQDQLGGYLDFGVKASCDIGLSAESLGDLTGLQIVPEFDWSESQRKTDEIMEMAFSKVIPRAMDDANCLVLPLNENSTAWEEHCI